MVICLKRGANDLHGPADATATPIISWFIEIQIGLTFLMLAYPSCPGKDAIKWASVCLSYR